MTGNLLSVQQRLTVTESCVHFAMKRATRALTRVYDEALADTGLTIEQFTLLVAVSLAESRTLTTLAEHLVMERTTLSRNLRTLERDGLIDVRPDPADARARVAVVTDAGEELLGAAYPRWETAQRAASQVLQGLPVTALHRVAVAAAQRHWSSDASAR